MLLKLKNILFVTGTLISTLFCAYTQQSLNNPGNPSGVLIGDLDITGNQITVEALIYRTAAGGPNIVSKHTDPSNVNYLLRPTTFELTTTNGFLLMNNPYTIQNNRWYHIAGTYDGAYVRYYVNGCLVVEQPWTGNLVTNNLQACIGNISTAGNAEGFIGRIDEVRIWNIARTESQIKQNMINLPAPGTYPNLRAYYKFDGNYNNILGTGFNGVPMGSPSLVATTGDLPSEFQIINVDATDNVICHGSPTGSITVVPSVVTGTTYSLNGGAYQGNAIFYDLTAGTYTIDVRSQEGCILTETVTIADGAVLQASPDQSICSGESVQLNVTGGSGDYTWDADPTLSSTTISNPVATPSATTSYIVRSKVRVGSNLVTNGNFEMGNVGFTTGYNNYVSGQLQQGSYTVTDNPVLYNGGFAPCGDHTSSTGQMLLADAACGSNGVPANTNLWCQTILVSPNTDYEFSAWMTNVVTGSSSSLLFSINGTPIGNPAPTSATTCEWNEFFVNWNSGGANSATICIAEGTGVCSGNDFAVDDISFYEVCELVDTVVVTVSPELLWTISGASSVCLNAAQPEITFEGSMGVAPYTFTYTINGGAAQTISSDASGIAVLTVPTASVDAYTYVLTNITDANGCSVSASGATTVAVHGFPVVWVADAAVCDGETVDLTAAGAAVYTWSPALNLSAATGATVTFTPGTTTAYTVVGTDVHGCSDTVSLVVTVHSLPSVEAGPDVFGCEGDAVTLSAAGAGAGGTYVWNSGAENGVSFIPPAGATVYIVTGTDVNGCEDTDSLTVTIDFAPDVSFTASQSSYCAPVTVQLNNTTIGSVQNCLWLFDDGSSQTGCGTVSRVFSQAGVYGVTLQVETPNGCFYDLSQDSVAIVDEFPVASFNFNPQTLTTIDPQVKFINTSSDAASYIWNFGDGNLSTEESPEHQYPDNTGGDYEVRLIAISEHGCRDTALAVIKVEEQLIFFVPNTFTPDGNQFNQTFEPVFTAGYDPFDYTLLIFNRWGEIIFESHDAAVGWDGTYNGKMSQEGTYTWKIEVKTLASDERKSFTGHVNLIR